MIKLTLYGETKKTTSHRQSELRFTYIGCISSHREEPDLLHGNNNDANQHVHIRRLICAFVFRSLENVLNKLATYILLIF